MGKFAPDKKYKVNPFSGCLLVLTLAICGFKTLERQLETRITQQVIKNISKEPVVQKSNEVKFTEPWINSWEKARN